MGPVIVRTMPAPPVAIGPLTITPTVRSITSSGRRGAVTLAWPSSVHVSRDGRTSPAPDVTKIGLAALTAFGAVGVLVVKMLREELRAKKDSLA